MKPDERLAVIDVAHEVIDRVTDARRHEGRAKRAKPRRVFEGIDQICPFEVSVLDEVRDFYWYPDNALYIEDVEWTSQAV